MSPPTAKKVSVTDALTKAFAEAEGEVALSDADRAALVEAASDPRWIRISRGDAFERLVCEHGGSDDHDGE